MTGVVEALALPLIVGVVAVVLLVAAWGVTAAVRFVGKVTRLVRANL
jgi:hypothetical protein